MNMADFIAKRRKEKGMTQKQLADLLGVTDKAVSKWERGNGYPDITCLTPLAEALGVTPGELLQGTGETQEEVPLEIEAKTAERLVKNTLDYASNVYNARTAKWPFFLILSFYLLGLAGILTTSIVDFALNRSFTWSAIPIWSIVYTWLCVTPVLFVKKRRLDTLLLGISVFSLPYLFFLQQSLAGKWFFSIAAPMFFVGTALMWTLRWLFGTKLNPWNKTSICLLICVAADAIIDFLLRDYGSGLGAETLLSAVILGGTSLAVFIIGKSRQK